VEGDVPVHVGLGETNSQDSVTFANKPGASMTGSFVMVIFTSDIDLLASIVVRFTPFVTSFFWVAASAEIDIDTFVAQSEFFANSIHWIDWLPVSRSQVMLSLWQAPASVVTVSSENGDFSGLH